MTGAPRIALLGAFPFPLAQGSQIYFEAQARALIRAGARCTLFTYGRGEGEPPKDLRLVTPPAFATPTPMRSGPSLAKPVADAALLATWIATARRRHFDAVLAHNAEAAAVALAARGTTSVPVIYVAHTLLGDELPAYLPPSLAAFMPSAWLDRADATTSSVGARIDEAIARSADGFIVLSEAARARIEPYTVAPLAVLPPGLDPQPAPAPDAVAAACHGHALEPGHFHLYTGNLDGYQELDLLDAAARLLGADEPRVVLASHDSTHLPDAATRWPALRCISVRDFHEMRALTAAATSLLLPRKRVGGFPVKLLNYMEAARPIIAHAAVAEGLKDGESACLLDADAGAEAWAEAMRRVEADGELAARLGRGARARLEQAHAWPELAQATLGLVARVVAKRNL
jgi:glycosyltransferase involved in cell wall biosynthesis